MSPYLCVALLVWQLTCYIGTALTSAVHIPPLLQSLGLLIYARGAPAFGCLLAQLGVALYLAALARSNITRCDRTCTYSYDKPLYNSCIRHAHYLLPASS